MKQYKLKQRTDKYAYLRTINKMNPFTWIEIFVSHFAYFGLILKIVFERSIIGNIKAENNQRAACEMKRSNIYIVVRYKWSFRSEERTIVGYNQINLQQTCSTLGDSARVQLLPFTLSIQQKLLSLAHPMVPQHTDPSQPSQQVYGFLCQNTNVFYAFESYETYQQFSQWLQNQPDNEDTTNQDQEQMALEEVPCEEEQVANCEMATREILKVFDDPIFELSEDVVEMREIDF